VRWKAAIFGVGALVLVLAFSASCATRARMCSGPPDCDAKSACVAGRCQLEKATVRPAIDSARRLVVPPVDVAYVHRGDAPSGAGAIPPVVALGKDGGKLFLRFEVGLPAGANVVEAYLVLHRSELVDDDPTPVSLHVTRIVDAWKGGSVSWAFQPRSTETRAPSTVVEPGGSPLVRLDVRELVRQWARRDPRDQGIAVVAENETRTGTTFALTAVGAEGVAASHDQGFSEAETRFAPSSAALVGADLEPYLELYLR
jgi:hypothetical protein